MEIFTEDAIKRHWQPLHGASNMDEGQFDPYIPPSHPLTTRWLERADAYRGSDSSSLAGAFTRMLLSGELVPEPQLPDTYEGAIKWYWQPRRGN